MRTESLSIALRARTPWEASDLGIALVREYAVSIWRAWACVVLPVALLLGVLCQYFEHFSLAALLLWWLKPVFDRIPLFVLSRAVFGQVPSLRETLSAQRSAGDIGALFALLTWRRLQPMRALLLPVDFLERLRGAPRALRASLLARAQGSPSSLLTFICVNMESMLVISILLSALLFVPTDFFSDAMKDRLQNLFTDPPLWAQWVAYAAYTFAVSIMEPFYVGAGFGLYLNRRMELEAWDIDLSFRQLAARLRSAPGSAWQGAKSLLMIVLVGCAINAASAGVASAGGAEKPVANAQSEFGQSENGQSENGQSAHAEGESRRAGDTANESPLADTANESDSQSIRTELSLEQNLDHYFAPAHPQFDAAIKKALSDPALNPKATISEWQAKVPNAPPKPTKQSDYGSYGGVANGFGFLLQNALWIVLAVAIVLLAPYVLRMFGALQARPKAARKHAELAQHDADLPEHLPADLAASVTQLWQQGKRRDALALLYRAGVLRVCERLGQAPPKAATESDCLRLARELAASDRHRALFPAVVQAWQGIAYASREPSFVHIQDLLASWQMDTTQAGQTPPPVRLNPQA